MNGLPWREDHGHTVITLPAGQHQEEWLALREQIHRQFIGRGQKHLVLDCALLTELPSIAIGAFTCLARDLRPLKGTLQLAHVSENSRRVMARMRLDAVIPVVAGDG